MYNMKFVHPLLCFTALSLSACSMAPSSVQLNLPVQENLTAEPAQKIKREMLGAHLALEQFVQSDVLQSILKQALENNRDLRAALSRIEQARAMYRIERADRLPQVDATGSGSKQRFSDNGSTTGSAYTSSSYQANLAITAFELDLFGRVKSLSQAALEDYLAMEEAAQATRLSLIAEVSNAYLQYLASQEIETLANNNLASYQATYELIQTALENGASSQLDAVRVKAALEQARSAAAAAKSDAAQAYNMLVFLAGGDVKALLNLDEKIDDVTFVSTLPEGMRSDVLLARPDVMQAEHTLQSLNASIGAARANFFPRISLTGAYGFMSRDLSDLFTGGSSSAWSFTPSVTLPLFAYGKNMATLGLAKAKKEEAVSLYEKAVQNAFREVKDELADHESLAEQYAAAQALWEARVETYRLSYARYDVGMQRFADVLQDQRAMYEAEKTLVNVKRQKMANLINLYKSLGGGRF